MRFFHSPRIYAQLPMQRNSHLPPEGFGDREVQLASSPEHPSVGLHFTVYCRPVDRARKGAHRLIVKCTCGREIPFGRMGQHYRTHEVQS